MSGMTYKKMEQLRGIQWPCNEQYPNGKERLYTDGMFPTFVMKWNPMEGIYLLEGQEQERNFKH